MLCLQLLQELMLHIRRLLGLHLRLRHLLCHLSGLWRDISSITVLASPTKHVLLLNLLLVGIRQVILVGFEALELVFAATEALHDLLFLLYHHLLLLLRELNQLHLRLIDQLIGLINAESGDDLIHTRSLSHLSLSLMTPLHLRVSLLEVLEHTALPLEVLPGKQGGCQHSHLRRRQLLVVPDIVRAQGGMLLEFLS